MSKRKSRIRTLRTRQAILTAVLVVGIVVLCGLVLWALQWLGRFSDPGGTGMFLLTIAGLTTVLLLSIVLIGAVAVWFTVLAWRFAGALLTGDWERVWQWFWDLE
ncbi:MAG: hypothetical protein ACPG7F_00535 [Aggregatilineales bacterium]